MKRLAPLLALLLIASPVAAASSPPAGLAGTLTITAKDATTVTLHAEQTGGSLVTLTVEHYCYVGDVYASDSIYAGFQKARFTGSADLTFNIGPRSYHGSLLTPTSCWALLEFPYSSSRVAILARADTLP